MSIFDCTGNCFNTQYYIDLINKKIVFHDVSLINTVEDEFQLIIDSKRKKLHCDVCYERSKMCLWYAYELLSTF